MNWHFLSIKLKKIIKAILHICQLVHTLKPRNCGGDMVSQKESGMLAFLCVTEAADLLRRAHPV